MVSNFLYRVTSHAFLESPFRNTWEVSEENYGIKEHFNLSASPILENNAKKIRFNYAFGPHFRVKISKWYPIFKSLKMVPIFIKTLTPLERVSRVSSSIFWIFLLFSFWIFFIFYFLVLNFLKKIKKLPRVKLSSCHVAVTEWRGNDNDTCQYYARCHFLSLNLVSLF